MSPSPDEADGSPSIMSSSTAPTSLASPPVSPPRGGSAPSISTLRDELKAALEAKSSAETRASVLEAELSRFKDQFTFANAAKEALETQLREEVTRREKAEEKVELLRGQVEQARRGVMQLQKQENDRAARRQSANLSHLSGNLNSMLEGEGASSTAKKRSSLYLGNRRPLSGQAQEEKKEDEIKPSGGGLRELRLAGGHGRNKSMTLRLPPTADGPSSPKSPRRPGSPLRSPRLTPLSSPIEGPRPGTPPTRPWHSPPTSSSAPLSTTSGGMVEVDLTASPSASPDIPTTSGAMAAPLPIPSDQVRRASNSSNPASFTSANSAASATRLETLPLTNEHVEQLKAARVETAALRAHVEALEMKLAEADEARAASEDCLKALREFLAADPGAGEGSVSLPPMPHEMDDDLVPGLGVGPEPEKKGWGFGGLFKSEDKPAGPDTPNKALSRRGSTASTSPSIAVSPPPTIAAVLSAVPETTEQPTATERPKLEEKGSDKAAASGWLSGWRSTSTAAPPPPPPAQPEPAQEGANLGRSLTSFFGRRARAATREAQKAEEAKADAALHSDQDDIDAPLSSAIADAAAAETSELGLQFGRMAPSESEGSLKTVAASPETPKKGSQGDGENGRQSPADRVAAAKAKAEALAAERAEKRRRRAAERLPGALTADQLLAQEKEEKEGEGKSETKEFKEDKEETTPTKSGVASLAAKSEAGSTPTKAKTTRKPSQPVPVTFVDPAQGAENEGEDAGLAYLSPSPKPALAVLTDAPAEPAPADTLSPPIATSTKSSAFAFDARSPPLRSPSLQNTRTAPRRRSSLSSPVSPALASPVLSARPESRGSMKSVSPRPSYTEDRPDGDEQEELASDKSDGEGKKDDKEEKKEGEEKPAAAPPKRPQRRNASKRGRGAKAQVSRQRGGFV